MYFAVSDSCIFCGIRQLYFAVSGSNILRYQTVAGVDLCPPAPNAFSHRHIRMNVSPNGEGGTGGFSQSGRADETHLRGLVEYFPKKQSPRPQLPRTTGSTRRSSRRLQALSPNRPHLRQLQSRFPSLSNRPATWFPSMPHLLPHPASPPHPASKPTQSYLHHTTHP